MTDQLKRDRLLITVEEGWSRLSLIEVLDSSDTVDSVQLKSPASTYCTPTLTASDEEEIELLEQQTAKRELDESEHLSQLGDSTGLFSPVTSVENSPEPFQQFKEARLEPRQSFFTSDNPFSNSGVRGNTLKARQTRGKMVVEREPPKPATFSPKKQNQPAHDRENMEKIKPASLSLQIQNQPSHENMQHPEFGMASPLQNQLQSSIFNIPKRQQTGNELQSNVFNIPKRQQPRAEHHRPTNLGYSHLQGNDQTRTFGDPYQSSQSAQPKHGMRITNNADFFEIPRPANHPAWSTQRPVQPTFSSFVPATVDTSSRIGNFVDLTSTVNQFNPDRAMFDDTFGAADPYEYVDIGKATENIKALLEGAFDDDEDKPRTRARKKKVEAVIPGLADKLQSFDAENEQNKEEHHEEEDEGDEDDGTIEGLRIKLLPHQVEGVEWMRDKEVGTKKKNGVLPKGGILADDVRWPISMRGVADCTIDGPWENHTVHIVNAYESSTSAFSKRGR